MKKFLFISVLFFSGRVLAQTLQTVTTNGNTSSNAIRVTGEANTGASGGAELVLGVLSTQRTNDTRCFIGWKNDNATNPTTNGFAGTLLLQARSNIADIPIDFVTGTTTPSLRMRIAGNGNVSIGDNSTTPASRLLIKGSGSTYNTTSLLVQNSAGASGLQVLDNGYVGVGVSAVANKEFCKLGIKSSSTDANGSTIVMERAHTGGAGADVLIGAVRYETGFPNATSPAWSGVEGHAAGAGDQIDLRFFTANGSIVERMRIDQSGNIGIGTTTPSAKLHVAGKTVIGTGLTTFPGTYNLYVSGGILTEKIKAALSSGAQWADYVFENNYQLKSLKDVEEYINNNKHLPGIPSADQLVKEGGIDMNEMFAKQMEKIEELTLYIIQMSKDIKSLKDENAGLKSQLKH